jgi:hypothetical protein
MTIIKMELKVNDAHKFLNAKSFLTIISILIWCYQLNGQSKVPPRFMGNCLGISSADNLSRCLSNVPDSIRKKLLPCSYGIGMFTFKVMELGNIENITFEGDLPFELITNIKANIRATTGKWQSQTMNGEPIDNLPFVFIFFADIAGNGNCGTEHSLKSSSNGLLSFSLQKYLSVRVLNVPQIIVTDTGYILPVGSFSIMR